MRPPAIRYESTAGDGTPFSIRPIQPEDRDIERAFVRGLSSNSRYMRFFSTIKELSPDLLDRFTQVDFPNEMALIATIEAGSAELEIGVARYMPGGSASTAEFAVVVADDWQGRRIGQELLRHLFLVAKDAGFERIEGLVLKANTNMLRMCREIGFEVNRYPDDSDLVQVAIDL